ncbi:MAG TPA: 3'-5' exonuclease, partial [Smithellaceae bacterium]|nr:3'-5' exonuclease [Smithellaceae bacterium]
KNEAVIGDAPLRESDIAVLVRTNFEAANFQRCLNQKGIKAVLFSMESVFVSREAQELKMLLDGLIHHEDEGYILAALATPLFSLRAGELAACNENEAILELWRSKFKEYFKIWSIKGFLTMFCSLLDREHLRRIIVARSAGERRLTNYLHLAEEIHQAQTEGNLSPAEVLNWLALMRQKEEIVAENEQLRLETDRECVRLVTIHKSKGLEYPVVFCPFAWETAAAEKESVLLCFHDEKNSRQLTGDLGSDYLAPNSEQYRKEMLAENCRLLYVALTRARNRCYFVWGKIKNTGDSPAAYLFHRRQWLSPADWEDINNEEMLANLSLFADQAPADIKIKTIGEVLPAAIAPRKEAADMLPGREFNGSIDRTWKIASFTYFTNLNRPQPEETTWGGKNDEQVDTAALLPVAGVAENMLSFPRGAITGIMLHEILEKIDFTTHDDSAIISNIYDKLAKYNFNLNWQPAILSMIKNLLKIPLGGRGLDKFTLAQLPANSCQKEMEFYFPLRQITAEDIIKILDESGLYEDGSSSVNDLQKQISFPVTQGYLKGFMDLILENDGKYYLADWKSNYLGEGYAQYSAASLRGAMSASSYILQYLIYTVALNRYLQKRMKNYDYEKHFGGVYYIFLRGVNPQEGPDNGIYYDLPAYSLVRRLDRLLLGEDKV